MGRIALCSRHSRQGYGRRAMNNEKKLTEAQLRALEAIVSRNELTNFSFSTGEVLRRRGLVERDTCYVVRRVYADAYGEHEQFNLPPEKAVVWHEWWATPAGRSTLSKPKPSTVHP